MSQRSILYTIAPYFRATCNVRPHLHGSMGGLKIEEPLYTMMYTSLIHCAVMYVYTGPTIHWTRMHIGPIHCMGYIDIGTILVTDVLRCMKMYTDPGVHVWPFSVMFSHTEWPYIFFWTCSECNTGTVTCIYIVIHCYLNVWPWYKYSVFLTR